MKFTLPNIISLFRIAISPVLYYLLISGDRIYVSAGCILFLVGAYSDYLDGMLARKYKEVTRAGVFMDPLADKILTAAAFIAFVKLGIIGAIPVVIILLRDVITTLLRIYAETVDMPIKTSYSAKLKTFLQMIFIGVVMMSLFLINTFDADAPRCFLGSDYVYYSIVFLTALTVWTMIEYFISNRALIFRLFSLKK